MKAFILAGGFATRLWPLTEHRAKPLLPLAGVPIIEHLVRNIPEEIPVTVSTNAAFKEGFEEWTKTLDRKNLSILIEQTTSDDQKLGALGATAQWITQNNIDDDVLLLTGDNYCGFSIPDFIAAQSDDTALLAAHDIKDTEKAKSFGTVLTEKCRMSNVECRNVSDFDIRYSVKKVSSFEEKPKVPKTTLVSTGCSVLPRTTLGILKEYAKDHPDNVGGIFEELLRRGISVECFTFTEPWFDIGSFETYLEATQSLVGEQIVQEEATEIEQTICEGSVVVGQGSSINRSELRNVVTFENCQIDDCILTDCIVDRNCTLKGVELTGKMLREGTNLTTK